VKEKQGQEYKLDTWHIIFIMVRMNRAMKNSSPLIVLLQSLKRVITFKHRTIILVGLRIISTVFHGNQHFFNRIRRWGLPSSLSSLDMLLHGCIICNYRIGMSPVSFLYYLIGTQSPKMRIPSYDFAFPYCHPTLKFRKGSLAI
jgi:hypothetical protein